MDLDTNKDGKVDLVEGIAFVQGFMSATVADTLRVVSAVSGVLVLALTLWNAMHPAQAVPVPVVAAAHPAAPASVPLDTDAPPPAPADTDAPKAAQAPAGGGL